MYKIVIRSFFILFGVSIFIASLPEQIVSISPAYKESIKNTFPQGWAFFTKDPTEDLYLCYRIVDKTTIPVIKKNASSDNFFGLSRRTRFVAYECGRMIDAIISRTDWQDTVGQYNGFISNNMININVKLKLNHFKDNEEFMFIRFKPIPWAYAGRGQEDNKPYQYLRVKLHINAKV